VLDGLFVLIVLVLPLGIALIAFCLEFLGTYGDSPGKLSVHVRKLRLIGRVALSLSLVTMALSLIVWSQIPA